MTESGWAGSDFQIPPSTGAVALCGACRRRGSCQLGIGEETLHVDGTTETTLVCPPEYEGGPMVAHGGWTAAVFDEVLGHVPMLHRQLAVTGQLNITFVKPVPVGRPLHAIARLEEAEPRRWHVAAELFLSATGAVLGQARAIMVLRDPGHFARHQQWLEEQDALAGESAAGQRPAPS